MKPKNIITLIVVGLALIIGTVIVTSAISVCDAQEWIVVQPLVGEVYIQENPGPYFKWFAKTWAYPRNIEFRYNDDPRDGDEADGRIEVTFNDGGTAQISTYIRCQTPLLKEDRLAFHQQFGGNAGNIKASIKSFMIDCMKSTAPLMSASENQSARKSEFRQMVLKQMTEGLYDMNLEEVIKKDTTDTTGQEITVYRTTIKLVNGKPVVTTLSPITDKFKMEVTQFSVTGTEYDTETRKQFAAKKEAYLGAEMAKAERSQEVQERLMIIERGLREKAQAEAAGNVAKETAVIAAKLKAEVALQVKIEAETKASMILSVADFDKKTLLMAESAIFEQAVIAADTALEKKKAMIALAEGKKQAIELSGDITQLEEAQIRAEVDKVIAWSEGLAKFQVPQTMIFGGGGVDGKGIDLTNALFQMRLMQGAGLIDQVKIDNSKVTRRIARPKNK